VWEDLVGIVRARRPAFLLLPDPFTFDSETLVAGLDAAFPESPKIGGLASGGREPGANALYLGDTVYRAGAVGVALAGNVEVDTVVAQGCRPIGEPMFVTRADQNVLQALDGQPALAVLQELLATADARDRQLFANSLFLGVVMKEQEAYRQGDFLIRNLLGIDGKSGAIAVGAALRTGMVVQFHLRDAATSAQDSTPSWRAITKDRRAPPVRCSSRASVAASTSTASRPRHCDVSPPSRPRAARRLLLQRRDRTGAWLDLPARLHELVRALSRPRVACATPTPYRPRPSSPPARPR
jgi:small ligand-binding sensory domain FIST